MFDLSTLGITALGTVIFATVAFGILCLVATVAAISYYNREDQAKLALEAEVSDLEDEVNSLEAQLNTASTLLEYQAADLNSGRQLILQSQRQIGRQENEIQGLDRAGQFVTNKLRETQRAGQAATMMLQLSAVAGQGAVDEVRRLREVLAANNIDPDTASPVAGTVTDDVTAADKIGERPATRRRTARS